MCGIVGYKGKKEASSLLFEGLKKLEYRGYDSAGIATIGNPSIKVAKGEGTIDEVLETELDGNAGIGHTRWATHGKVNDTNAHPHTDCSERVAVVHNGIINNYSQLKEELEDHEFKSDTDTEVIPHLIEEELEKTSDVREIAQRVARRLEGSYAIVAAFNTGEMIAFKDGSPLVLGEKEGEIFLASDVTPFLEHTSSGIFLEDGDLVVLDDNYSIFNRGEPVEREPKEIDWDAEEASKQGHEHFMEKEIKEQPTTVKRAAFQDRGDMEKAVELVENADKIYLTACGTAGIAASLGAKYLRKAGYEADVELAHEMEYRTDEIGEDDLVIAVSQSGETADLLSVLDDVESDVLSVVNVVGSTLDRISDHSLYVNAG
ncbi:MAG: isomerizing glutamine--fructose-6-phosphate transaminase, partial [Candidatus Aenigmatarchaeota archaeon]